jgi:hypothetical protein
MPVQGGDFQELKRNLTADLKGPIFRLQKEETMYQLAWYDYADKLMAYGRASDKIDDAVPCQGRSIPVTLWPIQRLTYTHRIGSQLEIFPLGLILPQFVLKLDDITQRGSSVVWPRVSNMSTLAHPSFSEILIFHFDNFFDLQGIVLMDLFMAMPAVFTKHQEKVRELHAQG